MRAQIQQTFAQGLIRIVGRGMVALAFALLVAPNDGAAHPGQQSKNRQTSPLKKMNQPARRLSDSEILEARKLLDQLGYWVNLEARGNDVSLRHAMIAFQKIEDRKRTGELTREEIEALRVAQRPRVLETGYPHIEIDLHRQVLFIIDCSGAALRILPISSGSGE